MYVWHALIILPHDLLTDQNTHQGRRFFHVIQVAGINKSVVYLLCLSSDTVTLTFDYPAFILYVYIVHICEGIHLLDCFDRAIILELFRLLKALGDVHGADFSSV